MDSIPSEWHWQRAVHHQAARDRASLAASSAAVDFQLAMCPVDPRWPGSAHCGSFCRSRGRLAVRIPCDSGLRGTGLVAIRHKPLKIMSLTGQCQVVPEIWQTHVFSTVCESQHAVNFHSPFSARGWRRWPAGDGLYERACLQADQRSLPLTAMLSLFSWRARLWMSPEVIRRQFWGELEQPGAVQLSEC